MQNFVVCEILGKQYKIIPNQPIEVDFLGAVNQTIEAQVLLMSKNGEIKVGEPFLKEKCTLDFLENIKKDKIRVAKFHPKANFRKVTGHRERKTRLVWSVKKAS